MIETKGMICLKNIEEVRTKIMEGWQKAYSIIIPIIFIAIILILEAARKFSLIRICDDDRFTDMLTALITCMSIIISIFGFLIPSLISAKNDAMVKYFIENADMKVFVKKLKNIIILGLVGIFLTILLYLYKSFYEIFVHVLMLIWIGIVTSFACNAYRFISLIIELLLTEKHKIDSQKRSINALPENRVEKLNDKLPKL